MAASSLSACLKSPSPTVGELIKIAPPRFTWASATMVNIPSHYTTLTGTCDTSGYGLEYKIDSGAWTAVPGDCNGGSFSIPNVYVHRINTVYARTKTKFQYTSAAALVVHYLPPPSSTVLSLAQSSFADDETPRDMQNVIGHTYSAEKVSNTNNRAITTYMPGMTYGH